MFRFLFSLGFLLTAKHAHSQELQTPFEIHGKNYSATYDECIEYYYHLEQQFKGIRVLEMGPTDAGLPLHLVLLNAKRNFNPEQWRKKKQVVLLINNGIHPGEPDGIDASMLLTRDILLQMEEGTFPEHVSLAIIPVYNIGGALNRSPYYRVDQNGPDEFGSRGNSQNLDLNRDFIKCDSKEAMTFATIFQYIQPNIFMDNHVSDGADYSYIMTLASTQPDKLGGVLGSYLRQHMEPELFQRMQSKGFPMQYYVNAWSDDAAKGWNQFFDSPRYSSGYAALFNCLSFVPETHMLKAYPQRVESTYALMQTMIDYCDTHHHELLELKQAADNQMLTQQRFPVSWILNENLVDTIPYSGYQYEEIKSEVSGLNVKIYNRNHPIERQIPFHNHYQTQVEVTAPAYYIIPQGWHQVLERLQQNNVVCERLEQDSLMQVQAYYIRNYTSSDKPYEGHHMNHDISIETREELVLFRKGDYIIPLQQRAKRFLIETLEPQGMDSYFAWNFFDPILNQKEGFTPYAFEQFAADYLKDHPELRLKLEEKKRIDSNFAADAHAQLEFVYRNSPYVEPHYQRYPVYRLAASMDTFKANGAAPKNKSDE